MPFPKLQWGQWCLFGIAAVVLLLPVVFAATAPALAPLPTSHPGWEAPPLPDRETPLPGFQDLLDPLPLVVRDLPDQASQDVAAAYDRATLLDPQPSRDMLAAAERAITVPLELEATWNAWLRDFTSDSGDIAPIPDVILDALRDDPRNADRLSNLAVARYFMGLTKNGGHHNDRSSVRNALILLDGTSRAFPDSRAPVLNYAFLSRFYVPHGDSDPARVSDPIAGLAAWSEAHPEDVTALQMLVSGYLSDHGSVPETIVVQLNQLTETLDAPRAALGHALLGDLMLRLARSQRSNSPHTAEQTARQALQEYDRALELSDDPSIYAARAVTLEFLGDIPAAIKTQERAVSLDPDSVPLRILFAEYSSERGGEELEIQAATRESRETGREAFGIAADQRNPFLGDVQIRIDPELYHGHRRNVEYTAFRPARTYLHLGYVGNVPGGSASYIVSYDLIQKYDREPKVANYVSRPAERAAYNAIIASVVLGDSEGAAEDADKLQLYIGNTFEFNGADETLSRLRETIIPAAQLVADPAASQDADSSVLYSAVDALRYVGLPQQAATLCRNALNDPDISSGYRSNLLTCLGENAYLAGDYNVARQAFKQHGSPLYEGFVAQVAGDKDEAIRLYKPLAASVSDDYVDQRHKAIAIKRLGEIYLDAGDAESAVALYAQVIQPFASGPESVELQYARNNHSVALLMTTVISGGAPNCTGASEPACAEALAGFEAALRSDPFNPVYLLGKGWVERLMGNTELAMQTLDQAVQVDPTLFPALNDLGVLAVQAGDLPRARQAFMDALAVNPTYDLALWNLGVLEMQRGVRGVPRGQAYLARSILQNPSFISSGLSYRTDEGIYRVEFNEQLKPGAGWSFASATSVATTTFGLIAVLAMILRAVVYLSTDKVQSSASAGAAKAVAWLDRRAGRMLTLSSSDGLARWLPLLITLPALAFVTSWSALQENPGTAAANVFLALFAALTAVVAHEAGHALAALKWKAEIQPAQWGPGTLLALILLPVNLNAGPFPGQRIVCEDEGSVWRVQLGGPLANVLVALGAYILFIFQPIPALRLIALVQLAAVSYALLPFDPLDGAALSRSRPMVVSGLASLVLIAGLLFSVGML